jgi:hypothetical protein
MASPASSGKFRIVVGQSGEEEVWLEMSKLKVSIEGHYEVQEMSCGR